MDADQILDALRPLVLVVDGTGTVSELRGGYGGFLGHDDVTRWVGASVFDHVAPHHVDELASYFIESAGRSADARSLPLPFRLAIIGGDGLEHDVDIIPAEHEDAGGEGRWVVTVVPVALQASVSRSLEAEMAGAPRQRVKELLTEELAVDNMHYTSRWFLVDLTAPSGPTVTTARPQDTAMADAIAEQVAKHGWRPWGKTRAGELATLQVDELPASLQPIAAEHRWRRVAVTPVLVDGSLAAAYLLFGRVPDDYDVTEVNSNVLSRVRRLIDATALLIARWHDRDRLVAAATRDPLTGLANRDAFADALAECADEATLLYIDVDRFKSVNDRYGHDVGDRVLVEIARRIVAACRPDDVVARFGGDEFVVLLDGIGLEQGRQIGERIVEMVAAPNEDLADLAPVTVSVGLAPVVLRDDAVQAADTAMLRAKRDGRARLVTAQQP
ncbi:GGDEF domain-containing protein [Acidimicrobiia bacterium EGI L10123]|uniref:GGDEF domain-containing protein n=1 Tax=Salinilacustrithrix flava TaxID=2957203 RepID=UPI003D7C2231|nr:GGDEF domain-containing protein [Acidimicrobiia bacterium EGI L10123]